ncbi:MAG: nicotinamide-nucleotide amidase [Motiliproteus sp.]|jgi:nicotinamide-nucleotide amidase
MQALIETLSTALLQRHWTLVTAESCTGGGIAWQLTEQAGSSAWLEGGFITYSNAMKQRLLGVSAELLEQQGAVSRGCVDAMAHGALAHSPAQLSVAVSGIAGPGGGSLEKPVGTVWIAWARSDGVNRSRLFNFNGDRQAVREQAVEQAITGLLAVIAS